MPDRKIKLDRRYDWIGPPNPDSKIRPIKLRQFNDETEIERFYRLEKEKLNQWNSDFWAHHNQHFEKSKADFINKYKQKHGLIAQIKPDEMSVFYTSFLNSRKEALSNYNYDWYSRNASLIWPAIKVNLVRLRRIFTRK